jgi:hypothetical protein
MTFSHATLFLETLQTLNDMVKTVDLSAQQLEMKKRHKAAVDHVNERRTTADIVLDVVKWAAWMAFLIGSVKLIEYYN